MTDNQFSPESIDSKVALDREYRPIGTVHRVDHEEGEVIRIRISPHREFRQKHPEFSDESYILDARSISKLWGNNVVLDKDIDELVRLWKD